MIRGYRQVMLYPMTVLLLLACYTGSGSAAVDSELDGEALMQQVYERHQQFPYIYEEQSLVLEDSHGKRDTRRAKRYTRVEDDGTVKFLLLFDYPEEIRGVAVLAERDSDGRISKYIYLPAFGETLIESIGGGGDGNFLGTDFSIENLTGEDVTRYDYVRREDRDIDRIGFFVVDVFEKNEAAEKPVRRHFIRKDNWYITLTQHFDRLGRISRVQSQHDLRPVDGDMWRADMILMVDNKDRHQSLIKVSRRVYSSDYVPAEVFTPDWLYQHYPYIEPEAEADDMEETLLLEDEGVAE